METDQELIARFITGQQSAFAAIYERYLTRMQRLVQSLGASCEDAEDVTQEAFIDLHRHAGRFDADKGSFPAWLFTLARNRWINFCRRRKLRIVAVLAGGEDSEVSVPDPQPPTPEQAEKAEQFHRLRYCVERLALHHRVVMEMSLQEMSPDEIAQVLNIPVGTVYTRQYHAKPLLRKCLGGQ